VDTLEGLYSVRDVARVFALNESRIRYWAQTGFINPSGARAGRRLYTFRDLVAIRAAMELLERGIPLQRVRKNLQALREGLPELEQPLSRLRVRSDGERLVLAEAGVAFEPESGQLVLDFEIEEVQSQVVELMQTAQDAPARIHDVASERAEVRTTPPATVASPTEEPTTPYGWFLRGCACDGANGSLERAMDAYLKAIELDPHLAAAHTNLGNLHYSQGDLGQARQCYEQACRIEPDQPQAHYNLGNLLEEDGEVELAIGEYRRALLLDPDFADTHFNLALTLERVGSRVQALEHWRRYLELVTARQDEQEEEWLAMARERVSQLSAGQLE